MNVFNACAKCLLLFFFLVSKAVAQEKIPYEPLANGGRVLLFLVLIIGLILLLAWLVNKSKLTTGALSQSKDLKLVASLSLGVKEKIALVQVGDKQILVGITSQNINMLTELENPIEIKSATPVSFSELLKKAAKS